MAAAADLRQQRAGGGGVPAAGGGREAQLSCSAAASGRRPGEPAASAPAAGRAGGLAAGGAPALPDRRLEVQSTRGDGHGTSTRGDEQRDPIHSGEGYNGKFRFPEKNIEIRKILKKSRNLPFQKNSHAQCHILKDMRI